MTYPADNRGEISYPRYMTTSNRDTGERRSAFDAGFELHPIQRGAAIATASKWRDVLVAGIDADGVIELVDLFSGAAARVWNYLDHTEAISVGEPVSWHPQYGVLAAGELHLSVKALG